MKAKREEFWSMLEYTDPDIIIASETWLKLGKSTFCWHPISLVKSIYALLIPTG
jgi:hypothetical protein